MEIQLSIHPRNWPSVGDGKKSNTCKARNPSRKGKLAQAEKRRKIRRDDHATTIGRLPSKIPASAYRTPGSMKK